MENFTITIAREFASMGRTIAKMLSHDLGIDFYDRDIVEEVAKLLNLPVKQISDEEEKSRQGLFTRMLPFPLESDEEYMQKVIFNAQRDVIRDFTKDKNCIIVGRCSDFILEDRENVLNIFLYAPYAARLHNCVTELHMTEAEAKKTIATVDKARRAYHRKFAGYMPEDPEHKHFMIDSSVLGTTGTAELIAEIIRKRFHFS